MNYTEHLLRWASMCQQTLLAWWLQGIVLILSPSGYCISPPQMKESVEESPNNNNNNNNNNN